MAILILGAGGDAYAHSPSAHEFIPSSSPNPALVYIADFAPGLERYCPGLHRDGKGIKISRESVEHLHRAYRELDGDEEFPGDAPTQALNYLARRVQLATELEDAADRTRQALTSIADLLPR